MSWVSIVRTQEEISARLSKILENLGKLPIARRTTQELQAKYSEASREWMQFLTNHEVLIKDPSVPARWNEKFVATRQVFVTIQSFIHKNNSQIIPLEQILQAANTVNEGVPVNPVNPNQPLVPITPNIEVQPGTSRDTHNAVSGASTGNPILQTAGNMTATENQHVSEIMDIGNLDGRPTQQAHMPTMQSDSQHGNMGQGNDLHQNNDEQAETGNQAEGVNERSEFWCGITQEMSWQEMVEENARLRDQLRGQQRQSMQTGLQASPNFFIQPPPAVRLRQGQQPTNSQANADPITQQMGARAPRYPGTDPQGEIVNQAVGYNHLLSQIRAPNNPGPVGQDQGVYFRYVPGIGLLPHSQPAMQSSDYPKISLQPFTGNMNDYRAFRDTFRTLVDGSRMTTYQKFAELRNKLNGDALLAINSLIVSAESYEAAWAILDDVYDNKRVKLMTSLSSLMANPKVRVSDALGLEKYVRMYEGIGTSLSQMNVTWMDFYMFIGSLQIDPELMTEYYRREKDRAKEPSYYGLLNFLKVAVEGNRGKIQAHLLPQITVKQAVAPGKVRSFATIDGPEKKFVQSPERKPFQGKCFICGNKHRTMDCERFLKATERDALLRECKVCVYCVAHKFDFRQVCRKKKYLECDVCKGQHITLMHSNANSDMKLSTEKTATLHCADEKIAAVTQNESTHRSSVMLPTAIVGVFDKNKELLPIRCLIDQCSQSTYITEELVNQLKLKKHKTNVSVSGLDGMISRVKCYVTIELKDPTNEARTLKATALVVKRVTGKIPSFPSKVNWQDNEKPLADPFFYRPSQIPILLGSNILAKRIFMSGVDHKDGMLLQQTIFGWIVSGSNDEVSVTREKKSVYVTLSEFETKLLEFWDIPVNETRSEDEINYCEALFSSKVKRSEQGHYIVPTPFKPDAEALGNSYDGALKHYLGQEARWNNNPVHKEMSDAFMQEYLDMKHMEEIPREKQKDRSGNSYYIKYLSVIRQDAITTKLRNVFNASAKSSSGISLNDQIYAGPTLLTKIFDTIQRVRQFEHFYTCDVAKMYRNILVDEEVKDRLRILWRANKTSAIREFRLLTVTYGLICAPWQAIRVMHAIADDHSPTPEIRNIIKESFYVDDGLHGADTVEECRDQVNKLTTTLAAGQMPLTKWTASDAGILEDVPEGKKITAYVKDGETIKRKLLGLPYDPIQDAFKVDVKQFENVKMTKRGLLSAVASLYDPLGLILPVVMMLRIMLQQLWMDGLDWDSSISETIALQFQKVLYTIHCLNETVLPRWIGCAKNRIVELIGFSDASGDGYGAVIYSRFKTTSGYRICLLGSKGRVTPLKTKKNQDNKLCTIPKMELEGIVLMMELYESIKRVFTHCNTTFQAYTDSAVCLAWIRNDRDTNVKFVKRRVRKIRKIIEANQIHHVISEENAADTISRGCSPEQLKENKMWFNGPKWMQDEVLPCTPMEPVITEVFVSTDQDEFKFIQRFSNYWRALRTMIVILRWRNKNKGPATAEETRTAKLRLVQCQQAEKFANEIKRLNDGNELPRRHWMNDLSPFVDEDGILRVGGRLSYANVSAEKRNPILLPKTGLADLIIRQIHLENGHSGNLLTERIILDTYWIPSLKQRVKKQIRGCVTCKRWKAKAVVPRMANLPAVRVNPSNAFTKVGVDLCGPFNVKASHIRSDRFIKVWVSLFICMCTKAVHLEIVSDLSTENFYAAFQRFTARCGLPSHMFSDCGTNFVGLKNRIESSWSRITTDMKQKLALQEITWKLNAPLNPTSGGLWEAGVKTFKYFIKRMANVEKLHRENFETLVCRIEVFMNKRPLNATLDNDEELALTPFMLCHLRNHQNSPLDLEPPSRTPLTKQYALIHQLQAEFWEKFQSHYITTLQKRFKWKFPTRQLKVNDVVLLEELNTLPGDWRMGRIVTIETGKSGEVRKVEVKTAAKEAVIRAPHQLVPILTEEEDNNEEDDEVQPPRRSPRSHATSLLTKVLLLWLTSTYACAMTIKPVVPGMHVIDLGEIWMKQYDLQFEITTSINITRDMNVIQTQLDEFKDICHHDKLSPKLWKHCTATLSEATIEARLARKELEQMYKISLSTEHEEDKDRKRNKRMVYKYVLQAGKFSVKHLKKKWTEILVGGALIAQQIEIENTQNKLQDLKSKTYELGTLLKQEGDVRYETTKIEIQQIKKEEIEQQMASEIDRFVADYQLLLTTILAAHNGLDSIKPIQELKTFLNKSNLHSPPGAPSSWFQWHPVEKAVNKDMVILSYKIPIVEAEPQRRYAIISVPDHKGTVIDLESHQLVEFITTRAQNSSYGHLSYDETLGEMIDGKEMLKISPCYKAILDNKETDAWCIEKKLAEVPTRIITIAPGRVLGMSKTIGDIKVNCGNITESVNVMAALIDFEGCAVQWGENIISATEHKASIPMETDAVNITEDLSPVMLEMKEVMMDSPELQQIGTKLREVLASIKNMDMTSTHTWMWIGGCLIIIGIVTTVARKMKCLKRNFCKGGREEVTTMELVEHNASASWNLDQRRQRDPTLCGLSYEEAVSRNLVQEFERNKHQTQNLNPHRRSLRSKGEAWVNELLASQQEKLQ